MNNKLNVYCKHKVTQLQEFWGDLVGRIYFVDNLGESSNCTSILKVLMPVD